jgi:hypothetical protein
MTKSHTIRRALATNFPIPLPLSVILNDIKRPHPVEIQNVLVFRSQSANRIDELYYKGMRLEETQQREKAPKVVLAGHIEEGKKKDTPAPLWAGAYTRRVESERRQTG